MIDLEYRNPMHKLGGEPLYRPPPLSYPRQRKLSRADRILRLKFVAFLVFALIVVVILSLIPSNGGSRFPEDISGADAAPHAMR
jgi:hypothetical protein